VSAYAGKAGTLELEIVGTEKVWYVCLHDGEKIKVNPADVAVA
jgi:hypothetical protein